MDSYLAKLKTGVNELGIRGLTKTLFHSWRHTRTPADLMLSPHVICEIDPGSELEISHRFSFGVQYMAATHPDLGRSKLSIHENATVRAGSQNGGAFIGPCSVLSIEGDFSIGSSFINSHCRVLCQDRVEIGDECAIGWNFQAVDSTRHQVWVDGGKSEYSSPITVKDNVFIGHDVTLKKGVTINEGAIIASNSVVVDDVPSETLVAGTPARVVDENVKWD